jgi:hypothetical protein
MPSPFTGMNPYLEQDDVWQDFHDTFVPFVRDALATQVIPHYIVKMEAHPFIHEPAAEQRFLIGSGDVGVDIEKHLFLEIRDRMNRDLVAVIEMLSPSNKKSGADREQYHAQHGSFRGDRLATRLGKNANGECGTKRLRRHGEPSGGPPRG